MEVKKEKLNISLQETIKFQFGKNDIVLFPYISPENKIIFTRDYLESYFATEDSVDNYFGAELRLALEICDKLSNVNVIDSEDNVDVEILFSSGLWDAVKSRISNYAEFRNDLSTIVKNIKEQKEFDNSIETVVGKLGNRFIDFAQNIDLNEDNIRKILEKVNEVKEEMTKFDSTFGKPERAKRRVKKE
jgi:hypothetical protein